MSARDTNDEREFARSTAYASKSCELRQRQISVKGAHLMPSHRWFVVAEFGRRPDSAGDVRRIPASLAHAKEMGSLATRCGRRAETWQKFWDQPFPTAYSRNCPDCLDLLGLKPPEQD